jgi:hypothetical protein
MPVKTGSSSSMAMVPLLAVISFIAQSEAFNAPRLAQQYTRKSQTYNVEMALQLRLPPITGLGLPSPSSWMGSYLRAIDTHNGDLQITRRGQ